jgi:hypothetical protein
MEAGVEVAVAEDEVKIVAARNVKMIIRIRLKS